MRIPGTVDLPGELAQALDRAVEAGYARLPRFEYYAVVHDEDLGGWHLLSVAGLTGLVDPGQWNVVEHGAWYGTVLLARDGAGWTGAVREDPRFETLLSAVPEDRLAGDVKTALRGGSSAESTGPNPLLAQVYPHLPFQPGSLIQYGMAGVHSVTSEKMCVDLFTDGNTAAGHAPNQLLASQGGAIDWVCTPYSGQKTAGVRIGGLYYYHMLYDSSLHRTRSVAELGSLGALAFGNIGTQDNPEHCGYAVQNSSHGHVHLCFPRQDTVTFGGWTLNTTDEKWRSGSSTVATLGWFKEAAAPPPPPACPDPTADQVHVCTPALTPAYSNNSCSTYWYPINGFNGNPAYLTENAASSSTSSNSGRWTPNLPSAGRYRVEAYIAGHSNFNVSCSWGSASLVADTTHAQYSVRHAGGTTSVVRDQAAHASQWMSLGEFDFNAGTGGYVTLSDVTGETRLSRNPNFGAFRFTRVVPVANPVPAVSSILPATILAGYGDFGLTVNGSNFVNGAVVQVNGSSRATTFLSSTQLQAAITAADVAVSDSLTITVFNPAPGGGTSNGADLLVANPSPVLTGISPEAAPAGSGEITLTLTGSSFVEGAAARWNDQDLPTQYISSGELRATIPAAALAASGTAQVRAFNPTPGGGTSAPLTFTIHNPTPLIAGLSPGAAMTGSDTFILTVRGSGFVEGAEVRWNDSLRVTLFISSTELQAVIPRADLSEPGSAQVTVVNPAPCAAPSGGAAFTIGAWEKMFIPLVGK